MSLTIHDVLSRVRDPVSTGAGKWMAFCPAHSDGATQGRRSLSIKEDAGKVLLYCFAGCEYEAIISALGLKRDGREKREIVATYDYRDASGKLVYEVVRLAPKGFRQRRPDGAGGWVWNMRGVEPVPFRLPELLTAIQKKEPIFIVEGEKDVLNLAAIGLVATCNHGGAGKWWPQLSEYFPPGTDLAILPDNDEPGRKHAEKVARALHERGCRVRIVELPGLEEKGDVSEWLAAGGTAEKLMELAALAPVWEPEPEPEREQPDQEQEQEPAKEIRVKCLADVEPEQVEWLWEPYLPKGKITLLEGDPAAGKTWVALAIAAAVSTGAPFPDACEGRCIYRREPGRVIYLSAEDGIADTLRPRLDALGADVNNIYAVEGTRDEEGREDLFSFSDIALLDALAAQLQPVLIVVDPIQAYLGASVDMHRANETRPVLARLSALAERNNCAVLVLRHLSKAASNKFIYRGIGSIDFTAAARSVLLAGCNIQDSKQRAVVQIKSSLAPAGAAQGYELGDGFHWTGISELTASAILASELKEAEKRDKLEEAKIWLFEMLKNGPVLKRDIEELAQDEDIAPRTLRRAKKELGVISYRPDSEKNPPWFWKLPGKNSQNGGDQVGQLVEML